MLIAYTTCMEYVAASSRGQAAERWYTTDELATMLGVDPSTIRRWRTARPPQGPPFVRVSDRVTIYAGRMGDLLPDGTGPDSVLGAPLRTRSSFPDLSSNRPDVDSILSAEPRQH